MRAELDSWGARFVHVPWVAPANLSAGLPFWGGDTGMGSREFMKLHALNLTQYRAVVFYDTDIYLPRSTDLSALVAESARACSYYSS